jgi:hypothetical protein
MGANQGGNIGWAIDESNQKPDYRGGVKRLLLTFTKAVGELLDAKERELLEQLLTVMDDNIDVTRRLLRMIDAGASVEDVQAFLEGRRDA